MDMLKLSTTVKETLVAFAVSRDESYGAAIEALWTMQEKLATQNADEFLRFYVGLCVKDLVHSLTLPPALMQRKLNTQYSTDLDSSSSSTKINKKLFTPLQYSSFQKALKEACDYFKSVSQRRVHREKLLTNYKTSEFGSELSSSLQVLANNMFPEMLRTKAQGLNDFQASTDDVTKADLEQNTKLKENNSSTESEECQNLGKRALNLTECRLRKASVCLEPLDQHQDQPIKRKIRELPVKTEYKSSSISVKTGGKNLNSDDKVKLLNCRISLKRLVSYEDFVQEEVAKLCQLPRTSNSDIKQDLSNFASKRKRKVQGKDLKDKEKNAVHTNKENLTDPYTDFEAESVPSSDLDDSDAENDVQPCSDSVKKQKTWHQVPVPDLQQFIIMGQTAVEKTTPCSVLIERLIL